jgi:hypothetical protein
MNGNVADEALLREDMGGGGRYSGGMKPPMDEKSNGYVDRSLRHLHLLEMRNGPSPHSHEAQRGGERCFGDLLPLGGKFY